MRVLMILVFVAVFNVAWSQQDPLLLRDDGLPLVSPRNADTNYNNRNRERQPLTRQHIPGTINRTDELQQQQDQNSFGYQREVPETHYESDTTRVYSFDKDGKPIKNPYSVYREQTVLTQDTVRRSVEERDTLGAGAPTDPR